MSKKALLWCLMKKRASSSFNTYNIFYDKTNHKSINDKEFKSDNNSHRNRSFKINSNQGKLKSENVEKLCVSLFLLLKLMFFFLFCVSKNMKST